MSNTDSKKRLTPNQLSEILELHRKWIYGAPGGVRANLSYANLSDADLSDANLFGADLSDANLFGADLSDANLFGADLSDANLSGADLSDANLFGADLSGADLSDANLFGADLSDANLSGADLSGADLSYADLSDANLSGANLSGANLSDANLLGALLPEPILDLTDCKVGYKKVWDMDRNLHLVIELRFPAGAELVSTVIGRKCRASEAVVVRCVSAGHKEETEFRSMHDRSFIYRVGETVRPVEPFDDSITVECTSGIHFFVTREEAEAY